MQILAFLLLILTVIVVIMILLWSRWNCIKNLNFKTFPEESLVLFYTESRVSAGRPCLVCAACSVCVHCVCHTGRACAMCTHTHAMVLWTRCSPHPLCLVAQLHITKFFVQKTYLKGWWSIWVVLWAFTPHFLPLIRQTSPPNPPKEAEGSGRS